MISFDSSTFNIHIHVHENQHSRRYISFTNLCFMKYYSPFRTCTYRKLSNSTKIMHMFCNVENFRAISYKLGQLSIFFV